MNLPQQAKRKRVRRNALSGNGPIVDRARVALKYTAAQFGEVTATDQTSVSVRTADGLDLTLQYDGGNFVFSRVYNLTISARLPISSKVPNDIELSHRDRRGPAFVRTGHRSQVTPSIGALNASVRDQLGAIDLVSANVSGAAAQRTLTLTPMGGSYVWVLIPPVFKATAFPPGEVDRMLQLMRSLHDWAPVP